MIEFIPMAIGGGTLIGLVASGLLLFVRGISEASAHRAPTARLAPAAAIPKRPSSTPRPEARRCCANWG